MANTNHPNRRRLPYRVRYGEHEAAFSDLIEARNFARWSSVRFLGEARVVQTLGEEHGKEMLFVNGFENERPA